MYWNISVNYGNIDDGKTKAFKMYWNISVNVNYGNIDDGKN